MRKSLSCGKLSPVPTTTSTTDRAPLDQIETQLVALIRAGHLLRGDGERAPTIDAAHWPLLVRAAERNKLMPLLHHALKTLGRRDKLSDDVNEKLTAAYMHSYFANARVYEMLAALQDDWSRERIPAIVLKGPALAMTLYGDIALRPFGDCDLLVRDADVVRAIPVLTARGFASAIDLSPGFSRRYLHEQSFVRSGAQPSFVDLHWHLFGITYYRARCELEWFWQHTRTTIIGAHTFTTFDHEAQFLHLCAHLKLHHRYVQLSWTYDLALLLMRHGEAMDWAAIIAAARHSRLILALRAACDDVRTQWGVTLPPAAASALDAIPTGVTERAVFRIATARDARLVSVLDIWYRRGVRAKCGYWFHILFPSAAYMQLRYEFRSRSLLPLYYLRRLVEIPLGLLRAAFRLLVH